MARNKDQNPDNEFMDIELDGATEAAPELEKISAGQKKPENLGPGVLLYDNKRYAVGLRWLVSEDETDVELAKSRAKVLGADYYCLRINVASQQGFGYLAMGHRVSMPALAACVGEMLVGEWHGVFVADNGWWYMAVHADNIAPDGDIFFTSEEDAYNHFMTQSQAHNWPRVYAPESWNIQGASAEVPLSKIIDEIKGGIPSLKPVTLDAVFSGKANKGFALTAAGGVFLLLLFSILGSEFIPSLIPTQAQLPIPNVLVSDNLQAPPKEPTEIDLAEASDLTSFNLIKPSVFLGRCLEGFSKTALPLPGWSMQYVRCKETFVETTWNRKIGTLDMVEPYLVRFGKDVTKTLADSNTLMARRGIPNLSKDEKSTQLFTEQQARAVAGKRFSKAGDVLINLVKPAPAEELIAAYNASQEATLSSIGQQQAPLNPITPNDLPYLDLTLQTRMPPNMIAAYFDLPGLVITSVEGEITHGQWKYQAKIILKPETRLIEANIKAKALQPK